MAQGSRDHDAHHHEHAVGPGGHGPSGVALEDTARRRLRSLRQARGWSLDELARRSLIGASTISRIETGNRRLALDQLVALARALGTSVDELLADADDADVVIRPARDEVGGRVHWHLNRPNDPSGRVVTKTRIPASKDRPSPRVHPGRDWFYVLEGTVRLFLGDREHLVHEGQAADFDTMTPHWFAGYGGPAEIISIFDRHGEEAHLRDADT
ncbi:MAG: XRE family transcriptional regulator [Actinomycetota bacterium]|nr:XRE family transcriptional regulator [Actinomycetota bacterium]